jgi:hypothetical protein
MDERIRHMACHSDVTPSFFLKVFVIDEVLTLAVILYRIVC